MATPSTDRNEQSAPEPPRHDAAVVQALRARGVPGLEAIREEGFVQGLGAGFEAGHDAGRDTGRRETLLRLVAGRVDAAELDALRALDDLDALEARVLAVLAAR